MNRILIASVALLGLAGVASAQESYVPANDSSWTAVQNPNDNTQAVRTSSDMTVQGQAAFGGNRGVAPSQDYSQAANPGSLFNENYAGK